MEDNVSVIFDIFRKNAARCSEGAELLQISGKIG